MTFLSHFHYRFLRMVLPNYLHGNLNRSKINDGISSSSFWDFLLK